MAAGGDVSEQPNPTPGHGDLWLDMLVDPIVTFLPYSIWTMGMERRDLGIARYGTPLQLDNGRDMRRDAREEALDLAVYLWGLSFLCAREGRWIAAWAWRVVARLSLLLAWSLR